jgi:hypothetical protein
MPVFAKALPQQPFQRITLHRGWYLFACYRKPDARACTRIFTNQERNTVIANSNIVLKNLLKIDCAR